MLELAKRPAKRLAEALATLLARTRVTPNGLTVIGFLLNVVVAAVLATGSLRLGGVLLLLAGAFDTLDGALARVTGATSRFGAFLDSSLDRYSEGLLLLGLLYDASRRGDGVVEVLAFTVILGSLMVSYCRARAEGLGLTCEVGFAPRPERVLILGVGLILGLELPALAILAVLTNLTALQRILHVYAITRQDAGPSLPAGPTESPP
ncbi:MAG TPA: CDP-alcohol phosphatidyltransferase family protein [Chloroflexota bacterium]|nr:CDP-alcohol phosphatidyltransferase family protein [Chloroflexota bacterium]